MQLPRGRARAQAIAVAAALVVLAPAARATPTPTVVTAHPDATNGWSDELEFDDHGAAPRVVTSDVLVPTPACASCEHVRMSMLSRRFPTSSLAYDGVLVLAASPRALARLTPETCVPLRDWVRGGGSLVIVGAEAAAETPCQLVSTPEAVGDGRRGARAVGQGLVTRVVTSAAAPTVTGDEMDAIYTDALARRAPPRRFGNPTRFIDRVPGAYFMTASAFLSVFALGLGPLLYARLKRRQRFERALVIVPLASVAAFAGLLAVARRVAPAPREVRVTSLELASGERRGRAEIVHGFVSPNGPVRSRPVLGGAAIAADGLTLAWRSPMVRQTDDGTLFLGEDVKGPIDYMYYTETAGFEAPGAVTVRCHGLTCTVTNETGLPLEGTWLDVPGRDRFFVGRVDAQASVAIAPRPRGWAAPQPGPSDERAFEDFYAPSWGALAPRPVTLHAVQRIDGDLRSLRVTCAHDCQGAP